MLVQIFCVAPRIALNSVAQVKKDLLIMNKGGGVRVREGSGRQHFISPQTSFA